MKNRSVAVMAYVAVCSLTSFGANEAASGPASSLARENAFALGGVGVAGTMSSGEKDLSGGPERG